MAWVCWEYKMSPSEFRKLPMRDINSLVDFLEKKNTPPQPMEGDN